MYVWILLGTRDKAFEVTSTQYISSLNYSLKSTFQQSMICDRRSVWTTDVYVERCQILRDHAVVDDWILIPRECVRSGVSESDCVSRRVIQMSAVPKSACSSPPMTIQGTSSHIVTATAISSCQRLTTSKAVSDTSLRSTAWTLRH